MDALLRHIDLITRQRDRARLDMLLVQAVHDMAGASFTRLYKLLRCGTGMRIGLAVEMDDKGCLIQHDDGLSGPSGSVPATSARRLETALALRGSYAECDVQGFCHLVLPLGRGRAQPSGLIETSTPAPLESNARAILDALNHIYENCNDLLDYCEVDTLTGLLNRKTFDEYLFKMLSRRAGAGGNTAETQRRAEAGETDSHWLGVLDIDHFKRINDGFGHAIGDEVLLMLANRMKTHFRAEDRLFRFGGEEFVLLLKPTSAAHAHAAFERFRLAVKEHEFPQVGRVTVSMGFAGISSPEAAGRSLENADRALYWAKEHGRNRVCFYDTLIEAGELSPQAVPNSEVELF